MSTDTASVVAEKNPFAPTTNTASETVGKNQFGPRKNGMIAGVPTPARTDYLTLADIAEILGNTVGTARWKHNTGQLPPPDITLGKTPGWLPETIATFVEKSAAGKWRRKNSRHRSPYLDINGAAARLGLAAVTFADYRLDGRTPDPDVILGNAPGWLPATLDRWQKNRPGTGWRAGVKDSEWKETDQ